MKAEIWSIDHGWFWLLARSVLSFEPQDPLSRRVLFQCVEFTSLGRVILFSLRLATSVEGQYTSFCSIGVFSVFDAFSNSFADTFHKAEVVNAKWRHKTRLKNSMKTAVTHSLSLRTNQTLF